MTEINLNDWDLTPGEAEALERTCERMNATSASVYRTSEGLRAFIIDAGGGRHLGQPIVASNPEL